MTDEELSKALAKALFECRKLSAEVGRLKYNLRKMRQELRQERAEHRQTALRLAERTDAR